MAESQLCCGLESILYSQSLHIELNFHLLLSQPQTALLRSPPSPKREGFRRGGPRPLPTTEACSSLKGTLAPAG